MSSHHFVKEKQEPAIYIHSEESLDMNLLGQLLEWCPFVIADEHSLYVLNHEPIKIDLVIHRDLSLEEIQTWTANQSNLKILSLKKDEDKLSTVLQHLINENHFAISLVACSDEHFEKIKYLNLPLDIIQYHPNSKAFFVNQHFQKWKEKDSLISIDSEPIDTKNLVKQNELWRVMEDGLVEISVDKRTLLKEYSIEN